MLRATSSIRSRVLRGNRPREMNSNDALGSSLEIMGESSISTRPISSWCCSSTYNAAHPAVNLPQPSPSFTGRHRRKEATYISHRCFIHTTCSLPLHQAMTKPCRLHPNHPSTTQKRSKVFVSKHNTLNLSPHSIASYITSQCPHLSLPPKSDDFRITNSHVILKECIFCSKPTNGKPDNLFKLYIQVGGGAYFCHRCGAKGSWYDLKSALAGFSVDGASAVEGSDVHRAWNWRTTNNNDGMNYLSSNQLPAGASKSSKIECLPMPPRKVVSIHSARMFDPSNDESSDEYAALKYLTEARGLSTAVLRKYGVGCATYKFPSKDAGASYISSMCVTFPWLLRESEVAEQEELRGAEYIWKGGEDIDENKTKEKVQNKTNTKKKQSETSALERHLIRQQRKDKAKAAKTPEIGLNILSRSTVEAMLKRPESSVDASKQPDEPTTREELTAQYGSFIPRRIKVRSIEKKSWQRLDPPGGGFGLFGWHTIPHDATEIIITEGEFDAMAICQATGRPAVSLPNGCRSLPMEVLVLLEKFDTVYLWMDNDGPGREGAEMFARKMGVERCLLVQPSGMRGRPAATTGAVSPPKDANEALLTGWDIEELLAEASELPHERILKFSDLRDQVLHEIIHPEKYRGAPMTSLPGFTALIKGFRRGEMTVLTGPTGSGKTTFLGQASLDLAEQGINVLWGSFEIKNTRLMQKLLQQYTKDVLPVGIAEKDLSIEEKQSVITTLSALADKFESLPLYFMKFHGGSDVDDVLDAMEYAAYVHDVEHIILDNMQFMISRQAADGKGSGYDKFEMQDIAVEKFRKFATEYNVHVTLVVHPRKEDEGAKLGISSFYGSAKATQEADTVLILQSDGNRKYLDVKKNRFDGTIGHVPLHFQRKSGRYSETPEFVSPPATKVPAGISAVNGMNTTPRASGPVSIYQSIRDQHPV
ncbi:hypothetical protein ACHAW6_009034 [Cyclotella cf. meneghiniana]